MDEVIEVIEKYYMFILLQLGIIVLGFIYIKKKELNDKLQYDTNYKKLMLAYSELAKSENDLRENYNKLNEKDKKIEFLAYYDTLTKLPNKENLLERLQTLITSNICTNGFSMIFIDVDNFKNINDILGHDYGDKLLILICEVLKLALPHNTSLYRWGGDEFIIILENYIEKEEIIKVAHRILNYFKYEFEIGEKQIYLTLSMGITIFPEYGDNSNDIIKNAEVAMYESKKLGRNKYNFYNIEMYSSIKRKDEINKYLKTAKSKNEFKLVFQPKFDNKSREIIGYEALIRWYNSGLGQVSPNEFIAVAEESDLIIDIGDWVIRTACIQNQKWIERGYRKPVAVNVSAVQFERDTFASSIMEILKETNMSPELLEIEITETIILKSFEKSIKTIEKLKRAGIKVSLDDFGTGYSSLSYLKNLPIDFLKIDKSFIDDVAISQSSKAIINGIVQLAHIINIKVIAEGIETIEQYEILKDIDCDFSQGFYFSKPLTEDGIEKILIA